MIENNEKIEQILDELLDEIADFPNTLLNQKTDKSPEKTHKSILSMSQSLENMRIYLKYLLFDLDATRRESSFLRKLLEEKES